MPFDKVAYQREYMRKYRKENFLVNSDKSITEIALFLALRRANMNAT